jgi:hypothetical protein
LCRQTGKVRRFLLRALQRSECCREARASCGAPPHAFGLTDGWASQRLEGLTPPTSAPRLNEWAHPPAHTAKPSAPGRSGLTPVQICVATDCACPTECAHPCGHLHRDGVGSPVRTSAWMNGLTPPASAARNGVRILRVFCPSASAAHDPSMLVRTRACTHTHTHAHTLSRTHINTHAHKQTQAHARARARTHVRTYERTKARTHTRTHTFKWENYQWQHFKWDRRTGDATMGSDHSNEGGCKYTVFHAIVLRSGTRQLRGQGG